MRQSKKYKHGRPLTEGYIAASLALENARKQGGCQALALLAKKAGQTKRAAQLWQMFYRYRTQVDRYMEEMRTHYEGAAPEENVET